MGKILNTLSFTVFSMIISTHAGAQSINDQVSLCAEAIKQENLASTSDYKVQFVRVEGAAAKRLTVELVPVDEGETVLAECKIRRGKVTEVALKA